MNNLRHEIFKGSNEEEKGGIGNEKNMERRKISSAIEIENSTLEEIKGAH